jgi:beta-aspartyl-peptidase (threonine type)
MCIPYQANRTPISCKQKFQATSPFSVGRETWTRVSLAAYRYVCFAIFLTNGTTITLAQETAGLRFSLAIHGGAGIEPERLSAMEKENYLQALTTAIEKGRQILAGGGTALEAVEQTIRILEDDPLFNAGKGAVFNSAGAHELDAAIVDGATHQAGAVAGVSTVKNPISLARLVMFRTKHVLLIGEGAERFADELKSESAISRVPNSYFSTPKRRMEWEEAIEKERRAGAISDPKSTVGCVARDSRGNLAAGTSTGGLTNKKWGRVGSVPIVGAGTFADNSTLAVSGTGIGEHFLRNSVGFHLHALMKYRSLTLAEPDTAGVIAVDSVGNIVMRCNTPGMSRASIDSTGKLQVLLAR